MAAGNLIQPKKRAVIIGNGVTGVSAAIRLRELRPEWQIILISGESKFHYSRPSLMYIFMGHMRYQDTKPYEDKFWDEQQIELLRDWVLKIDKDAKTLKLHKGEDLSFDKLLIATGSKSNKFGWPGQDLDGVQGLWDLMDLQQMYKTVERTKHAVIVGGGLIGVELAEMLHSRNIPVTFLVREKSYWDNILSFNESQMVTHEIQEEGFNLLLETELKEIVDDGHGAVEAVVTNHGVRIECQFVGLTAGVSPNIELAKGSEINTERGILVDWNLKSQHEDIYAAGDCAEITNPGDERNLIQQVWYTGKAQGKVAAENMAGGTSRYEPGIWYNSAKFLNLEYQTYGMIIPNVNDQLSLWWQHPTEKKALRIVHNEAREVTGFNFVGLRGRHQICESWLRDKRSVEYVLDHLHEANFDPEFFPRFEKQIASQATPMGGKAS